MTFREIIFAGLLFLSAATQAEVVRVSASADPANLPIGQTFTVHVRGEGFGYPIVGGAFALSFDTAALRLDSWAVDTGIWALGGGRSAVTGDYYFNAYSPTSNFPTGAMAIGDLHFTVTGPGTRVITLSRPTLNWATTGGQAYPNQHQIQYESLAPPVAVKASSTADLNNLQVGDSFTVQVSGEGFASPIVGGAFALAFDSAVLRLDSWAVDTSVWSLGGGKSPATGDYYFNAFSPTANYPTGTVAIGDLHFSVIGLGTSAITLSRPTLNWATTGGQTYPNQSQIQYPSLSASAGTAPTPVSVPALPELAVWVMAGLIVWVAGRRRVCCSKANPN